MPFEHQREEGGATAALGQHQRRVNYFFTAAASYWSRIYEHDDDVSAAIYQERVHFVLRSLDAIALPAGTPVLEVGCGAGQGAVALARRGHRVEAIDTVPAMVEATRARVMHAGLADRVHVDRGDVHALPFADGTFDLVVALGVLPWLPAMGEPLREMRRVLRDGGYVVFSVDNRWSLRQLLDPLSNPVLTPVKDGIKALLRWLGGRKAPPLWHSVSLRACDAALRSAGFEKLASTTIGFGPFSFLARPMLPKATGLRVHHRLQALAAGRVPFLRAIGGEYLVLGRKRTG